jgi:hypothetical protein
MKKRLKLRVRDLWSPPANGYCCFEIYNPRNEEDFQVAFVRHDQKELLDILFRISAKKPITEFKLINVADQIRICDHMTDKVKTYLFQIIKQYTNLK